uniref:Uncharacterized protein n=1 Tax=Trichobilharzia regenti TaxID=157069 RepID=A0AA85J830_TRIRE|nr:unnamed protein product [Trichobilharzia regenti]
MKEEPDEKIMQVAKQNALKEFDTLDGINRKASAFYNRLSACKSSENSIEKVLYIWPPAQLLLLSVQSNCTLA